MPRYVFEPLVVPAKENHPSQTERKRRKRPSWLWILRQEIEPLCAEYELILEYGDEDDESCAVFYDDEWV